MEVVYYHSYGLCIPKRYYVSNLLTRFRDQTYEKEEYVFIKQWVGSKDVVLDVGACTGFLSLVASETAKHVVSVEANPELWPALQQTIIHNKKEEKISVVKGLLHESKMSVPFQTFDLIVAGSAHRIDDGQQWKTSKRILESPCVCWNQLPHKDEISVMLLDIEGGELEFLHMYGNTLEKQVRVIIVELHERMTGIKGFDQQCHALLTVHKFKYIEHVGSVHVFINMALFHK
jgi:FkbM family methyltransferase